MQSLFQTIETTPFAERPRERCLLRGAQTLSVRECLALLLGTGPPRVGCLGLATRILTRPGTGLAPEEEEHAFFTAMESTGGAVLEEVPGVGPAHRARLLAAFELGKRYATYRESRQAQSRPVKTSDLSTQALRKIPAELRSESREWLGFIPYYRSSKLGELCVVERGVRTHVNVDPAELFARILALRPAGIYLVHNHPSGDTTPSEPDFDLTRRVSQLTRNFGVRLFGHWIVATHGERIIGLELP